MTNDRKRENLINDIFDVWHRLKMHIHFLNHIPDFVISFLLITILIVCVALFIKFTLKTLFPPKKYNNDIFDKRKKVHDSTKRFMHLIIEQASFEPQQWKEFHEGISDANLLFKPKIMENIRQIEKHSSLLDAFNKELDCLPAGDKRTEYVENYDKELLWFKDNFYSVMKEFNRYLTIQKTGI